MTAPPPFTAESEVRPMLTPQDCVARREALGWSKGRLAREARIGNSTVRHFEAGRSPGLGEAWRHMIEEALAKGEAQRCVAAAAAPGEGMRT